MNEYQKTSAKKDIIRLLAIIAIILVCTTLILKMTSDMVFNGLEKSDSDYIDILEFHAQEQEIFSRYLTYKDADKYIPLMETLLSRGLRKIDPYHEYIGDAYYHLAMMQQDSGKSKQAEKNYLQALEIFRTRFSETHKYIGPTYGNLGHTQYSQGNYEEALRYYELSHKRMTSYSLPPKQDLEMVEQMIIKTKEKLKEKGNYYEQ